MKIKRAMTIGEISRQTNWPIHRVQYFIKSRKIKPIAKAGILRIFSNDVVTRILGKET